MHNTCLINAKGINKYFGAFQVLADVDLEVQKGEAVGIVGPNGAGKTTLFGVLAGALDPSSGDIQLEGNSILKHDSASRCRLGIARTHQIPRPFLGMTVFENVMVAANFGSAAKLTKTEIERLAIDALEKAGMTAIANRPAASLGLLDRKRLELARALATSPDILLLDEIGGGLTEAELQQLVSLILELKQDGITVVWIEHILHALLKVIDRLVCMDSGQVIAQGLPKEVMANKQVMQAYLGSEVA
ncbi:ABC transporter ATP-binding protein [Marinomonas mediterranea]|uniref:ABC transporter ATP-binding protein n=1 Tax=Marinomonas mediterranea TaxID=119864 RepID=UPI00234BA742|nr:ABC transporter ATP-binding protein [Marinomonas mediterranea]WCN10845.1 ATP-binding cassette domain-containing protein [Marinomonas mediterranea]